MPGNSPNLLTQIATAFRPGQTALMPYFPLGYPDFQTSIEIVTRLCRDGADVIELGIPFSDPLADGPTIQAATQEALGNGISVARCLAGVKDLRERGITTPFILMSYYNPILQYGVPEFIQECASIGVNGLIIPDLPPEEAGDMLELARRPGMGIIFLITPNSPTQRIDLVARLASGFIYLVSLTGTTGARNQLSEGLGHFSNRVREKTDLPLALGFGISTKAQVDAAGEFVDGVIVGSALIDAVRQALESSQDPLEAGGNFIAGLRSG